MLITIEAALAALTSEAYRIAVESVLNQQPSLRDSQLLERIEVSVKDSTILIRLPGYARYIDAGRRPFARNVPFQVLYEWIVKKGINIPGVTQRQAAWMIQRSIRRKGIRARPFLTRLYADVERAMAIQLDEEIKKQIDEQLSIELGI